MIFKKNIINGFTLVELIIVITILSILSTISFTGFSSHLISARDSTRLSDLSNIEKSLQIFSVSTGKYPIPSNNILLTGSGESIINQGSIGSDLFSKLKLSSLPLDPQDKIEYYYSTNSSQSKYQILSLLEKPKEFSTIDKTYADYSNRELFTSGDKVGIILNLDNTLLKSNIDILNTNSSYKLVLSSNDSGIIIGTGAKIGAIITYDNKFNSCKQIKDAYSKLDSGIYNLSVNNSNLEVYCDMKTNGGGRSLVMKVNGDNQTFLYRSSYWTDKNIYKPSNNLHDKNETKNYLFSSLSFSGILLEFDTDGDVKYGDLTKTGSSLYDMFNYKGKQSFGLGRDYWLNLVPGSTLQNYCNTDGINTQYFVKNPTIYQDHPHNARIGINGDDSTNCTNQDSAIGIGLKQWGNGTRSAGSSGISSFVYLYVR